MPHDYDRPHVRRSRRRSTSNDSTIVALIVAGSMVLTLLGVAAFALTWQRRPAALPVAAGPADAPGVPVGLPIPLPAVVPPAVPPAAAAAAALAPRPALPADWVDFKHPEGAYSIYTPRRPSHAKMMNMSLLGTIPPGEVLVSEYTTGPNTIWCSLLVVAHRPEDVATQKAAEEAAGYAPPFLEQPTVTRLTWRGQPAVEYSGIMNQFRVVSRKCWVGNRSFTFSLTGMPGHPTDAERTAFFESFVPGAN